VAAQYATWLELGVITLVSPHTSVLGHLCGIAAGAVAVHAPYLAPFQVAWFYLAQLGATTTDASRLIFVHRPCADRFIAPMKSSFCSKP
jgi:hypothetical protein